MQFDLFDQSGKLYTSIENALETNMEQGITPSRFTQAIRASLFIKEGVLTEKYTVHFTLYDLISDSRITVVKKFDFK